jgi:hypothetical protein
MGLTRSEEAAAAKAQAREQRQAAWRALEKKEGVRVPFSTFTGIGYTGSPGRPGGLFFAIGGIYGKLRFPELMSDYKYSLNLDYPGIPEWYDYEKGGYQQIPDGGSIQRKGGIIKDGNSYREIEYWDKSRTGGTDGGFGYIFSVLPNWIYLPVGIIIANESEYKLFRAGPELFALKGPDKFTVYGDVGIIIKLKFFYLNGAYQFGKDYNNFSLGAGFAGSWGQWGFRR